MSIRLIAIDLDNTLLNSDKKITKENIKAIKRAMDLGIKVTISTGRMFRSALPFAQELSLKLPIVVYNGALVKEIITNKLIYKCSLNKEIAIEVMKFAFDRGIYAQTYIDDTLLIRKRKSVSDYYAKIANVKYNEIGDEIFKIKKDPHEVFLLTETEDIEFNKKVIEDLKEKFGNTIHVTFSAAGFIEIMNPNINKWRAIKILAKRYGIKEDEIMCIGDGNNDYEMIEKSKYGVAMANASKEIKDVATFITESNENSGVALIINDILDKKYF